MKLQLESKRHGNIDVQMYGEEEFREAENPFSSSIYIYNDDIYTFSLADSKAYVSEFHINEESVQVIRNDGFKNSYSFGEDNEKPFTQCFGAVQIKIIISGKAYVSDSISIMVTDNSLNRNVMHMIDYIYEKGEGYLYENYTNNEDSRKKKNITMEAKFRLLDRIIDVYEYFYGYFGSSPKKDMILTDSVRDFHRLDRISPRTMQYIASHPEELYCVAHNTGIVFNKMNFQPKNTLVSGMTCTADIYENRIVVGFLAEIISGLEQAKEDLAEIPSESNVVKKSGYIESKIYIYRMNRKSVDEYIKKLDGYIMRFQILYFDYKKIFGIESRYIDGIPEYTDTFRLVIPYNAVYEKICEWFHYGGNDFLRNQFFHCFISTSIIYEYYCLIKLLVTIKEDMHCIPVEEKTMRFAYTETKHYSNTRYNNTFSFVSTGGHEITLYFQPVIYGKVTGVRPNNISLYRNRYASLGNSVGHTYTPDYLLKISKDGVSRYVIMDAKFSSQKKVEDERLTELVYKYLFSVSPLDNTDEISGLVVFCGKDAGINRLSNLHDISKSMQKSVSPFAYAVNLSGMYSSDNSVIREILSQTLGECENL